MNTGDFIKLVVLENVDAGLLGQVNKNDYLDYRVTASSECHICIKQNVHSQSIWIPLSMILDGAINAPSNGILPEIKYKIIKLKNTFWRRFLFNLGIFYF